MKALHLLVVLALMPACGKSNEAQHLQDEADVLAKAYKKKLEGVDRRVQLIFKRGTTIPANLPGIEEVGKRLTEARDTIIQLNQIVTPGADNKSAVEKQAEAAAKAGKVDDLRKLVHDTETTMDNGLRVVNDDLNAVESWIALYDQGIAKEVKPTPTAPAGEPPASGQASPPPSETTPPTEIPPTNAGQGSAAAPEQPKQAPAQPKQAPAQPKQAPAQPKQAAPKQPAPAQPAGRQ